MSAQYAIVTQASPLLVRLRGSSASQPAKRVAQATVTAGDTVAVILLDAVEVTSVGGTVNRSGTLLVLGKVV